LPGSRRAEVERLLPVMTDAVARITARRPGTRVVLALAPTISALAEGRDSLRARSVGGLGGRPEPPNSTVEITIVRDRTHDVIRAADLVLATSGTVTLEAAMLGTPMVVCYRVSRLTAVMIRSLVRVPWMSLVNIVLGRAAVPELFQAQVTGDRVAAEALRLLDDAAARDAQRAAFRELSRGLGEPGVGARAAGLILGAARRAS
jgi:lipid-A-disaccharide synthase